MDWGSSYQTNPETEIWSNENPQNDVFPVSESFWKPTDMREEWAVSPEKSPVLKHEDEYSISSFEVGNSEKDNLEIVVNSIKKYVCRQKIKTGTIKIEDECHVPRKPISVYVNCGPDRFAVIDKYYKDDFCYDGCGGDREIVGVLKKVQTKIVREIGDGQYEERTEFRYTFPRTANITFNVAMNSDHSA